MYACVYCGSTDLVYNDDGFIVCRRCGTVQPFTVFTDYNPYYYYNNYKHKNNKANTLIETLTSLVINELLKQRKFIKLRTRARIENSIRYIIFNNVDLSNEYKIYLSLINRFGIKHDEYEALRTVFPLIARFKSKAWSLV